MRSGGKLKVGIIGTRGIPNNYGGFEQFAEYLSVGLVRLGHSVTVYNSHKHPYQKNVWNGVKITHCKDPEHNLGTIGQFIYDYNCIMDTRKSNYDIILQLGYTSSSIWGWLLPREKSVITTNMDGLEWKRSKFSKPIQLFLKLAEKLAIHYSDCLISDSVGIQDHIKTKYKAESVYIPYGAHLVVETNIEVLKKYGVIPYKYNMLIARLEPENSIEIILNGVVLSKSLVPMLVVGNHKTRFGEFLKEKFKNYGHIRFLGGIYDIDVLNNLRYHSNIYFHGHTVGGTNPSLLEAMGSKSLICANDNIFNKSILCSDAFYFVDANDVANCINNVIRSENILFLENNLDKIKTTYSWEAIVNQYLDHFSAILASKND